MFAVPLEERPARKPPAQYNWLTERYETEPEQLALPLEEPEGVDGKEPVLLLATENGSQLLVSGYGISVGKKSERVVVKQGKTVCAQHPMMRLQELVLASNGISVSSDLIGELCQRGIRISFLGGTGKPIALVTSPYLTATAAIRKAQFAAQENQVGMEAAQWIVAGKLRNQEKLLRYFAKSREARIREELEEAAGQLKGLRTRVLEVALQPMSAEVRGRLMGMEGTGGRMYWKAVGRLFDDGFGFAGRSHQGAEDPVNAALNYGYGILYTHVWGAAMNAGLEPFAGLLHTDRSGKPSMILDLVEEFRQPIVDRALLGWLFKGGRLRLERGLLDGASREAVAGRVMLRLNSREQFRGKEHEIRSIVQMQARRLASALREFGNYRPFTFRW